MAPGVRIGISVAALMALSGLLLAAESPVLQDSAPILLSRSNTDSVALTMPATGQYLAPVPRSWPHRISFGMNDLGGQLRLHLNRDWAAEGRFLTGSANSDVGQVHSLVLGMRGYRFLPEHRRLKLYVGAEGDYVKTSMRSVNTTNPNSVANASGFGNTSGYAMGGFGGMEFRVLKRIALDLDIGPYMIGLKEKLTGVSDASLDFVADTAINVYLF
jgi:hypothetical protein